MDNQKIESLIELGYSNDFSHNFFDDRKALKLSKEQEEEVLIKLVHYEAKEIGKEIMKNLKDNEPWVK